MSHRAKPLLDGTLTKAEHAVLSELERLAHHGERCLTDPQFRAKGITGSTETMKGLALKGRIEVCVHAKNWRVVHIIQGHFAGKSTQPPPKPWSVYLRMTTQGVVREHRMRERH